MKILVVGLGSMGKRRIRIMKSLFGNELDIYGVDLKEERRNFVKQNYNAETFENFQEGFDKIKPNAVFVCSSPLEHKDVVLYSLKNNTDTFSELNLSYDGYEEIIKPRETLNTYFLSSTMLYRKEIQWIMNHVKSSNSKFNYRYHIGQYLPDWHPWESYKDFFVNNIKTNGCIEIMAVEFPWILECFGEVEEIKIFKDKISTLDINFNDSYQIIFKHKNGTIGNISIDVVSRKAVRNLEIYSENSNIIWLGKPDSLEFYNVENKQNENINLYTDIQRQLEYADNIIENAYVEEIIDFFNCIKDNRNSFVYSYQKDLKVIQLIEQVIQ